MFRSFRSFHAVLVAVLAATAAGCSSTPVPASTDDGLAAAPQGPIINQATVYNSRQVAFDRGGNGNGNNGNGNGGGPSCYLPDSLVLNVGPAGGSFSANGSSFVVPKNALSAMTHIVMIPQLDSTVAIQFYPEGLLFNGPHPTLTINTDCIGDPANASIVYTDGQGNVLENKTTKGKTANSVTTDIAHFSRYAIAW